jgi:hypothetical protein
MTTQSQLSQTPVPRVCETAPAPTASEPEVPPRPTRVSQPSEEVRPYWGDRVFLLFWLGCALLIFAMIAFDFLKGLLGY